MDSCHLFNFLFGTRKATSELRKCFTASSRRPSRRQSNSSLKSTTKTTATSSHEKLPVSPLKQIQLKIINFASGAGAQSSSSSSNCTITEVVHENREDDDNLLGKGENDVTHSINTGTYKATLIELPMDDGDGQELRPDENNNAGISCNKSSDQKEDHDNQLIIINNQQLGEAEKIKAKDINNNKSERVRHLVRSFESSVDEYAPPAEIRRPSQVKVSWPPPPPPTPPTQQKITTTSTISQEKQQQQQSNKKPTTIVKPLPPKTPPKSKRVRCFNLQLTRENKLSTIEQLFQDEQFLRRHFFAHLQPLDRCSAAQVCRLWRNILYSSRHYWRDLVGVIDCSQLRRDYLIECIVNTLQHSARLKSAAAATSEQLTQQQHDDDEVWRIQELCNRYTQRSTQRLHHSLLTNEELQQQQQQQLINSKSSSIPSQISSTLSSSVSLSSLLLLPTSPSNEHNNNNNNLNDNNNNLNNPHLNGTIISRIDSLRERLYTALDERGFDSICLFGATDDDIEELINKTQPNGAQVNVRLGRLNNCPLTDRGLELFVANFCQLEELELTGCNELTNMGLQLRPLQGKLKRLIITDCVNIADGLAQRLINDSIFQQLHELTLQAYHLTDAFLDYVTTCGLNDEKQQQQQQETASQLRVLELPNCKELTNTSIMTIAKHFGHQLERLSISGSSKITDDGLELLCEHAPRLQSLDLSWCTKISDVTLECVACDLSGNLCELNLDRNSHITDIGLGYLATMSRLEVLSIRWCSRITDLGLESILTLRTLRRLALAGLHQITARSLLCLIGSEAPRDLEEVELTNCAAVNTDLMQFLRSRVPAKCQLIF